MHPLISWILFLGISGTIYIVFKGVPCFTFTLENKIGSHKINADILAKRARKKRRAERLYSIHPQEAASTNTDSLNHQNVCVEECPMVTLDPMGVEQETHVSLPASPKLQHTAADILETTDATFQTVRKSTIIEKCTYKRTPEGSDSVKTKKQKQNAVKREKQKQLKARMEEERLSKLREHQKMLEEERMKAQMRKAYEQNTHTKHLRSASGEWILVAPKSSRHVTPVFASPAPPQHGLVFH